MSDNDNDIEVFWARLRRGAHRQVEEPAVPEPAPAAETPIMHQSDLQPGDVVFGLTGGRCQVLIRADGTLHFGEGYEPDLAARIFWQALAQAHPNLALRAQPDDEVRGIHHQTMETMLLRVGRADLHNERAQLRSRAENASEHDHLVAEVAHGNLEVVVHNVIEYARALALRNGGV